VLVGPNAVAGEWGHNPLPWPREGEWPGPPCYCGKTGCIETFLSGPGMAADHARATGEHVEATELCRRAAGGDAAAEATLLRYEDRMARALATVVNLLDPDVIVLGGGMSNLARLYASVPRLWSAHAFSDRVDTPLRAPARRRERRARRGLALAARGLAQNQAGKQVARYAPAPQRL